MLGSRKLGFFYRLLLAAAVLMSLIGLIVYTENCIATGRKAVSLCLETVAPSLFPFFVVSNIIIGMGYAQDISFLFEPIMRKLFNVSGACACAFLMGIIGGYPVGARTAIELYNKRLCTKAEAERLLSFCNNSGPAFILGAVGTGMLGSARAGILLYAAHVLASVSVGVVFRFWKGEKTYSEAADTPERGGEAQTVSLLQCFLDSVKSAGIGVLNISVFVLVFSVLIGLLLRCGILTAAAQLLSTVLSPLGIDAQAAEKLLTGFLEVTAGLWSLAEAELAMTEKMAAASCLLGWAGLCVHCQVLSFLQGSGLAARPYLLGKLTQGTLATLYIRVLVQLFPVAQETGVLLEQRIERLAGVHAPGSLYTALVGALVVLLVMVLGSCLCKRRCRR